jgi:hypothetical protein
MNNINIFVFSKDWDFTNIFCESTDETGEDGEKFVRLADHEKHMDALREELASAKRAGQDYFEMCAEKHQRLTAAEQRNAHLEWLLDKVINRGDYPWPVLHEQITKSLDALKPTESGASE